MPSDLPFSRRSMPNTRTRTRGPTPGEGASASPLLAVLLGMAIGAAVMLILGLTWLVWDRFKTPVLPANLAQPQPNPSAPALAGAGVSAASTQSPSPSLPPTVTRAPSRTANASATHAPALSATHPPTPRPAATSRTPGAAASPTPLTYTVQPGDSLYQIANHFGVDVLDLMVANHIASPSLIQPGQVFIIPALGVPEGAGSGAIPPASAPSGPKSILVDIPTQHLYAYQGNTLVYSFTVSTGQQDGTLRGDFQILDKLPRPYSDVWSFWMPDWLGFYYAGDLENGFHALPVLPDGSQIWGDTLGTPTTYGCVVLGTLEAQLLYKWADVGTPVKIQ